MEEVATDEKVEAEVEMRLSEATVEEAATDVGVDTEKGGPTEAEVDTDEGDPIDAGVPIGDGDVTDEEDTTDVQAVTDVGAGLASPTLSSYFASGLAASLSTIRFNVAGTWAKTCL